MNQQDFQALVEQTFAEAHRLLVIKGGEYAGNDDRLANFKRGAALVGITPLQTAFIYASKHYDAVATFVRDEAKGETRPRSEGIDGRLDDLINYCLLMKAIIREGQILDKPKDPFIPQVPVYSGGNGGNITGNTGAGGATSTTGAVRFPS